MLTDWERYHPACAIACQYFSLLWISAARPLRTTKPPILMFLSFERARIADFGPKKSKIGVNSLIVPAVKCVQHGLSRSRGAESAALGQVPLTSFGNGTNESYDGFQLFQSDHNFGG